MQLGPFLQQCRLQSGHSLEDLARQLRITPEQLEALECDSFESFQDEARLKEVLKELADLVDLSPSAVLRLYQRQVQATMEGTIYAATESPTLQEAPETTPSAPEPVRRVRRARKRHIPWQALLILCTVVLLAVLLWRTIEPPGQGDAVPPVYEPARFQVVPPQGGMMRIVTTEVHQLRLVIDGKAEKTYRMEAGSGIRLQIRREAQVTWDKPGGVALFFNETPLPITQQTQARLVPVPEGETARR